jgi:hypothetical protein
VLRALLALFEHAFGPALEDFPEDAPVGDGGGGGFACPVALVPAALAAGDLAATMHSEIVQLAPWYDLAVRRRGRTTVGVSGLTVEDAATHVTSYLDGAAQLPAIDGLTAGVALKRACDDIKAYYYEAVAAQPGNLAPGAIESWFWRETVAAKVFLAIQQTCLKSSDESLQPLGRTSLIPRAVSHALGETRKP